MVRPAPKPFLLDYESTAHRIEEPGTDALVRQIFIM